MRSMLLSIAIALPLQLAAADISCPDGATLQGQTPPQGTELKCVLPDGTLHGPYKHWYSNGQLMQQLHYDHGREHGEQSAWWPNGQLMMQGISMHGKRYQGFHYWNMQGEEANIQFETIDERL